MQIPDKATCQRLIRSIDQQMEQMTVTYHEGKKIEVIESDERLDSFFKHSNEYATGVVVQATYMAAVAIGTLVAAAVGLNMNQEDRVSLNTDTSSRSIEELLKLKETLIKVQ
jgi:hypothetical protein